MHRFGLKGLRAVQAFPYISFYWREDIGERRGQDVRESEGLLSCASAGKPARARCDGRREIAAGRSPRREPSSPAGARHLRAEADARLRAADHSGGSDFRRSRGAQSGVRKQTYFGISKKKADTK
jgi:hypothetical protein